MREGWGWVRGSSVDQPTSPLGGTGQDSNQHLPPYHNEGELDDISRIHSRWGGSWVRVFKDQKGHPCLCVSLLLEQIVVHGVDLLEGGERTKKTTRVEEVQAVYRQEDHGTVHGVEVEFGGDDPP